LCCFGDGFAPAGAPDDRHSLLFATFLTTTHFINYYSLELELLASLTTNLHACLFFFEYSGGFAPAGAPADDRQVRVEYGRHPLSLLAYLTTNHFNL